jgi:hypothetical protein
MTASLRGGTTLKTMKFNSQICTSREQSERLLALGLKKETADMVLCEPFDYEKRKYSDGYVKIVLEEGEGFCKEDIPAWSLHRLLCLYNIHYLEFMGDEEIASAYDIVIDAIEMAINGSYFPEKYLV